MIGKRLKEQRVNNKMSQKDLAEKLGVSESTVQKWEQDITDPNTGTLIQIAQLLNCSIDYLFGFYNAEKDTETFLLIENINTLDSEQKKEVSRFVNYIKGVQR